MRAGRIGVTILAALIGLPVAAEPTAEEVQAAYLSKFVGYITWPPSFLDAHTPPAICVAGSEGVYKELSRMAGSRPSGDMGVRIVGKPSEGAGCHMVFVGRAAWKALPDWIDALKTLPVAVVTDAPGGVAQGALLTFVQVGNRVRFQASISVAQRTDLKLSSRLLAVAERVVEDRP